MGMTVLGSTGELRSQRVMRAKDGRYSTITVFNGTRDYIASIVSTLAADAAYDWDDTQAPLHVLTVSSPELPDGQTVEPPWAFELDSNSIEKDLIEHPRLAKYPPEVLLAIKDGVETKTAYAEAVAEITTLSAANGIESATALEFLSYYGRGINMYYTAQYVLRVSVIISKRQNLDISFGNVERLYSNDQVKDETSPPADIVFSIDNIDKSQDNPQDGSTLRWLKQTPKITQVSGGRFQVSLEYWLDWWLPGIYPEASL